MTKSIKIKKANGQVQLPKKNKKEFDIVKSGVIKYWKGIPNILQQEIFVILNVCLNDCGKSNWLGFQRSLWEKNSIRYYKDTIITAWTILYPVSKLNNLTFPSSKLTCQQTNALLTLLGGCAELLKNIQTLRLPHFSPKCLIEFSMCHKVIPNLQNLTAFVMRKCCTNTIFNTVASHCSGLVEADIAWSNVTDEVMENDCQTWVMKELTDINLTGTQVTHKTVLCLIQVCPKLSTLYCNHWNDVVVQLSNVKTYNISYVSLRINNIDSKSKAKIEELIGSLRLLSLSLQHSNTDRNHPETHFSPSLQLHNLQSLRLQNIMFSEIMSVVANKETLTDLKVFPPAAMRSSHPTNISIIARLCPNLRRLQVYLFNPRYFDD